MTKDREDLEKIIVEHVTPDISFVILFGSWAMGGVRHDSDVDLAIYLKDWPMENIYSQKFKEDLEESLKASVDVIVLNDADPIISMQALKFGRLIFCRDRDEFVLFKARKVSEYLDFKISRAPVENALFKSGWPKMIQHKTGGNR